LTIPLTPFVPNSLGASSMSGIAPQMFESQIKASYAFIDVIP